MQQETQELMLSRRSSSVDAKRWHTLGVSAALIGAVLAGASLIGVVISGERTSQFNLESAVRAPR